MEATLYHDGCEICSNIELYILDIVDITKIKVFNISIDEPKEDEAKSLGVKVFPAIVTSKGSILHINVMEHEGTIDCLINSDII